MLPLQVKNQLSAFDWFSLFPLLIQRSSLIWLINLVQASQHLIAVFLLLEILMRDKTWSDNLTRKTYIAILDIIELAHVTVVDGQIPPVDATVATYRRRLSSVVLS